MCIRDRCIGIPRWSAANAELCGSSRLFGATYSPASRASDGLQNLFESFSRPSQDCARAFLDDRALYQIRIPHHQLDDLIVREIAFGESERLVDRLLRAQQLPRRHLHLAKQLAQLLLWNRIDVVIDGIEVHAALLQSGVDFD